MSWLRAVQPLPAAPPAPTLIDRQVRLLGALLALDVFAQRLALPVGPLGQVPAVLLVALAVAVIGLRKGLLVTDSARLSLGLLALGATATATACSLLLRPGFSAPSYVYLVASYLPFLLVVHGLGGGVVLRRLAAFFATAMTWLAAAAVIQLVVQPLGWFHPDPVGDLVPRAFLLEGFNTGNPFTYGSAFYRTNGFVFLEPSFCSQFLGLGVLAHLWLRRGRGPLLLMLAGMLTTLTGTGPALVAAGILGGVAARQQGLLRRLVPALAGAALVAVLTPAGTLLLDRATEGGSASTSTGQRFVLPFTLLVPSWLSTFPSALVGWGPGSAIAHLETVSPDVPVVAIAPLKILYEYGALGGVAFLLFLGWCVARGARSPSLTTGVAVAYLVLSGSLQQPHTVLLVWVFTSVCQRQPGERATVVPPVRTRAAPRPAAPAPPQPRSRRHRRSPAAGTRARTGAAP